MEPERLTDPSLLDVLEQLEAREPIFHRPGSGTTRGDFETMMADGFWETGASGQRYSRDYVLDVLEQRHAQPHEDVWEAHDFHCMQIAPDHFLLTYTLLQDGSRLTRRATIWRRSDDGWKIVYHQGTIVAGG
ncbi:MAG TPA: DUF4440 domain-containing protein [Xanthomonadaceae bacterium]|jgi:hypothetical protein|nr:DUF4440 domain-containing protein [Xanthomonadaceae bacterium]